jgi:hypothetical protein
MRTDTRINPRNVFDAVTLLCRLNAVDVAEELWPQHGATPQVAEGWLYGSVDAVFRDGSVESVHWFAERLGLTRGTRATIFVASLNTRTRHR